MALKSIPGFPGYSLCLFSGRVISWKRRNPRVLNNRNPGNGYNLRSPDGTVHRISPVTLMRITYGRRAPIDLDTIHPED